jgi:hypothetical protein
MNRRRVDVEVHTGDEYASMPTIGYVDSEAARVTS